MADTVRSAEYPHYLYEPLPQAPGEHVLNLGLSFSLLPEPVVEQEIPAPAVDMQYKLALSRDWSWYNSLSTNYFTNLVMTGLSYDFGDKVFCGSVGSRFAFFAGYLDLGGEFDRNTAAAFAIVPTVRFGHRFDQVAVSGALSASYVLYADTHIGSLEDKGLREKVNDIFFTIAIEQPFYRHTIVSTGISITYSRTPYQSWMLYNVFDQYLLIPEFFFAFQLV